MLSPSTSKLVSHTSPVSPACRIIVLLRAVGRNTFWNTVRITAAITVANTVTLMELRLFIKRSFKYTNMAQIIRKYPNTNMRFSVVFSVYTSTIKVK